MPVLANRCMLTTRLFRSSTPGRGKTKTGRLWTVVRGSVTLTQA